MSLARSNIAAKDGSGTPVTGSLGYDTLPDGSKAPLVILVDGATGLEISPATAAGVAAVVTALGTPLQAGGSVTSTDSGAAITGATIPTGGVGLTGWLSAIWSKLSGTLTVGGTVAVSNFPSTQVVSASSLPLPTGAATAAGVAAVVTALGTPAQDGTDATGVTAPTGGVGIRGWLSGNYSKLTAIATALAGTLTTVNAAGSAIIGKVGIDQTTPGTTNAVATTAINPSTIYSGQQTLTTSAAALPSRALVNGVVLKASTSNIAVVYVGPSGVTTSTGYPLAAGEAISYGATNLSAIYIIGGNTTDAIAFTGN